MDIRQEQLFRVFEAALAAYDGLFHAGTPHEPDGTPHSGAHPWGSGDNPYQRAKNFYDSVQALKAARMSEPDIARAKGMKTTQLRAKLSNAKMEMRQAQRIELLRLVNEEGKTVQAAADTVGVPWTTAKNMLAPDYDRKQRITNATADELKRQVEQKRYLDIGSGTEQLMGISRTKLDNTVALLQEQGYKKQYVKFTQLGTGHETTMEVLTKDDVPWKELNEHKFDILPVGDTWTEDGGETWRHVEKPVPIDSNRIQVNYTDENGKGGVEKDGVIELRRGVDELSLGGASYAQVRIAVRDSSSDNSDGTNYMKGMAVYADDLPPGVDVRYNTNKHPGTPLFDNPDPMGETVFKKMKKDPENPFGASIKDEDCLVRCQKHYTDENGVEHQSAINVVNEEGDWSKWSKTLSSQFLSKQSPALAEKQLGLAYDVREEEFNELMGMTNATVKKSLLESFADECDAAASHLAAARLPGTASHVLLPLDIPDDQIYAPNYRDGQRVVLIRHPHGGPFEIAELTVNNKNEAGRRIIGTNAPDAVGISHNTATKLSGADYDGDTALVIPNDDHRIYAQRYEDMSPMLRQLQNFDPSSAYPGYPGMKVMSKKTKELEMGKATNLLTDATIFKCTDDEKAMLAKYTMVVIDAEKHKLNWRQARKDFHVDEIAAKYRDVNGRGQPKGASTIISRAGSEIDIPDREPGQRYIDPETGRVRRRYYDPETGDRLWTDTGKTKHVPRKKSDGTVVRDENGKIVYDEVPKTIKVSRMEMESDPYKLTSGGSRENPGRLIESVYANHADKLKKLARKARLAFLNEKEIEYSPSAHKAYAAEVASLDAKLNIALKNAPYERQAQLIANKNVAAQVRNNPDLNNDPDALKKLKGRSLTNARKRIGAHKTRIDISSREWEAIQKGAISSSKLKQILRNTDTDKVKQLAMPKAWKGLSPAKVARAKAMMSGPNPHPQSEVADMLGVSVDTLMKAVNGN